jgi:hypothetical protein
VRRRTIVVEPTDSQPASFRRCLLSLADAGAPTLVGGATAMTAYCGVQRVPKDLDVFTRSGDLLAVLEILRRAGFHTEIPYQHWLAKAYDHDGSFIDVIFNSGNGNVPVDDEWFAHSSAAVAIGVPVALCPAEEMIWSKAFVMERERFDGADVAHLLLSCGPTLDWARLLRRFGEHWPVLLSHCLMFVYAFPDAAQSVPAWVMARLLGRVSLEHRGGETNRLCRGTLLSREQYLPDLARGWHDARLPPTGSMSADEIEAWTQAIGGRQLASVRARRRVRD